MGDTIRINGGKNVITALQKFTNQAIKAQATGLEKGLETIAEQSLKECPVDTGQLRESMRVTVNGGVTAKGSKPAILVKTGSVKEDTELEANISYDTPYAVKQHEEMAYIHPEPGTKAKYLEDPFKANSDAILKEIETQLKGAFKV